MLLNKETRDRRAEKNNTHYSVKPSGAFIPLHLLPSGHAHSSTKLSVKLLSSPSPLSSPPVMTITFLGPNPPDQVRPDQVRPGASPLSCSQLSVVLLALCHGVHHAALTSHTPPLTVASWIWQQERQLLDRKWLWRTEKVALWVLGQREQQLEVSRDVLLQTARAALGEDSGLMERYSWSVDFLLRHELSLQPIRTAGFKHQRGRLPRSIRDRSRAFILGLSEQILGGHLPPESLGCMDEFCVFIDPLKFSVHDSSAFTLLGSSGDKPVFNVVLSALSTGAFLPPLLFFRGNPSHVPEGFPDNVLLEARREGFTDQERHEIWINKVWRPLVTSQCNSESVLMVDVHQGHLTDEFRDSLSSTDVVFIPSGCSSRLQPLHVAVTPVLKDFLQARWTQLVSVGGLDGLGLDQLALTLACWFSEVCFTLNTETHILRRSFASVCNLQEVEERGGAARMIKTLMEVLVQPLETSKPPPDTDPEPELELLLVVEEERMKEERMEEERMEEGRMEEERIGECEEEVLVGSPSALHSVFEGENDQEMFHGFMDD